MQLSDIFLRNNYDFSDRHIIYDIMHLYLFENFKAVSETKYMINYQLK